MTSKPLNLILMDAIDLFLVAVSAEITMFATISRRCSGQNVLPLSTHTKWWFNYCNQILKRTLYMPTNAKKCGFVTTTLMCLLVTSSAWEWMWYFTVSTSYCYYVIFTIMQWNLGNLLKGVTAVSFKKNIHEFIISSMIHLRNAGYNGIIQLWTLTPSPPWPFAGLVIPACFFKHGSQQ